MKKRVLRDRSRSLKQAFFCTLLLFFLTPLPPASPNAYAHNITLFCQFEGTTLYGEGYFSSGDPVKNSPIHVYDLDNGKRLASTLTSEEGTFSVSLEKKTSVKAILDAGQGHRASWTWDKTTGQALFPEKQNTDAVSRAPLIATGLTAIGLLFGMLYLWKHRHAA